MRRAIPFLLTVSLFHLGRPASCEPEAWSLHFIGSSVIADEPRGLLEPSGLTWAQDGAGFWTVSDDTKAVFRLDRDGEVLKVLTFDVKHHDFEGIHLDATGETLLVVQEKGNHLLAIDAGTGETLARRALSDLEGYETLAPLLSSTPDNKGLEGISVDPDLGTVYIVVEGQPRLLVVLAPDLGSILDHRILSAEAGFVDDRVDDTVLDVSGLSFDPATGALWIVSEKGARIFRYDLESGRAESAALWVPDGKAEKRLAGAEGVAFDPRTRRLFIVTDHGKHSRLVVYEVR